MSFYPTYIQLLLDVLDGRLQRPGALGGLVLHRLHRLQERGHVGHHHLRGTGQSCW